MRKLADCNSGGMMLYPKPGRLKLLYDNHYIMASLGVLSKGIPTLRLICSSRASMKATFNLFAAG